MIKDKRLIEETFPVKEVSIESAKEKNVRHGHISTLHTWWARRPLASSRATNYAALIPAPESEEELERQRKFIIEFCRWKNSLNGPLMEQARKEVLNANNGVPPKVLDPFGGGGAIPLEALRLGCETYSNDYNPVAVLIQKCTLEYPQKYGQPVKRKVKHQMMGKEVEKEVEVNPLLEDVKKWGNWVLEETRKEIGQFYPPDPDGFVPVGYLWARTVPCRNPLCGAEIPLMRQYLLANKNNKKISLYPYIEDKAVKFKIVGDGYEKTPEDFEPERGTIAKAIVTCPVCGTIISAKTLKTIFQAGQSSERMVAVVLHKHKEKGKRYRIATHRDEEAFEKAEEYLATKIEELSHIWNISPVPDEPTPDGKGRGAERAFSVKNYNLNTWGDLFNNRQKLSLISFMSGVKKVYNFMIDEGNESDYARAVISYLALGIDRLADFGSTLCLLNPTGGRGVKNTFGRQALPIIWDYAESNPFYEEGAGWPTACEKNEKLINHSAKTSPHYAVISQGSAAQLPYENNYFDAIFTDPPYYDNVPYSHLSDFFYVWLKRTVGDLYPELFSTPLTPKKNEAVAYSNGPGGFEEGKTFFENTLKQSFREIYRVLKPGGIVIIVYAHKTTEGWETLINSLIDSGLIVTGAWPIHTEMKGRLRATESAALASSIYISARKIERLATGFYNDVKTNLKKNLEKKLERLWQEGIGGADYFIAAIGSAIETFGKYEKVMDYEGTVIRADRLLEDVRKIATDYAVNRILEGGLTAEISDLTRYYILFRWNYKSVKLHFDEARKLAQSCNIDLSHEWGRAGFIQKEKEFIKVLGPQERKLDQIKHNNELIDVLHKVLLLWEKSSRDDMMELLNTTGYGKSEAFYKVAQAISETLPPDNKEKKLLDGFLTGKTRLMEETQKTLTQRGLFQ
ncbi:MAG TPA: DUF1156 domain-containing protein [Candidatus Deferrimicrobium sp.]|nr:DUF1156 domain-containing protein [Candidatus Deferrimicrobium sp.]